MSLKHCIGLLSGLLFAASASAEMIWSNNSFSLLDGDDYEVGDNSKTVFTLEHASGHSWGDMFVFVDRLHHNNDENDELYGEFQPNFSIAKLAGMELAEDGLISDFYLATQWEFGSNFRGGFDNFLYGAGVALKVPGFKFFKVNLYRRNNEQADDNNQLTLVWNYPFSIGGANFLIDGFLDAVDGNDQITSGYNFTPQIKFDLGSAAGMAPGKLFVGVEYVYWKNKFGIDGTTEQNPNLLIKWHL